MKKKAGVLLTAFGLILLGLLTVLFANSVGCFTGETLEKPQNIAHASVCFSGKKETVSLPCHFDHLAPRTPVTAYFSISPAEGDSLYLKSVYAPLKVYAGQQLIYQSGQPGSYPAWMTDPATTVALVRLPRTASPVCIRMEYLSSAARTDLTLHPLLLGSQATILRSLALEFGVSLLFSMLLILSGLILLLVAAAVVTFERGGIAFVWLGLFTLVTGAWGFGECNLTGLLIHNPTLLYLIAFVGLFLVPIPLLLFGLTVVDFHNPKPLSFSILILCSATLTALLLQLTGTIPFSKSMYLFHVLEPLALSYFTAAILYEILHYHNPSAQRFLPSIAVLAVFSVLEAINYHVHFTYIFSMFFNIGVFLFVLMTGVVGGMFIRDALRLRSREQQMKYDMELMEYRLAEQKKHKQLFVENEAALRAQRHDLRHQLTVIRSFGQHGENTRLTEYIDSLISAIPTEQGLSFCENEAVNAVVSHYAALAKKQNVTLTVQLTVPGHTEQISDSSLCVIFGNLIENALEACERMTEGRKFISLRSRIQGSSLTITMDNSFNGKAIQQKNGKFLSSKRSEVGIGLQSISAIAEKHGGGTRFEADDSVFLSSVYVQI